MMRVAIIGAGMAGLTAAMKLTHAGLDVTVFDKGKGSGGRLSSRVLNKGWIDHGTPYFSAENPNFQDFLARFANDQIIEPWNAEIMGQLSSDEKIHYIGVPRTSALTRAMLGEIDFHPSTHISKLERLGSVWQIFNNEGSSLGLWNMVIIAIPAPQAAQLMVSKSVLRQQVEQVVMEPCWVSAVKLDQSFEKIKDVTVFPTGDIRRVTNNSGKNGRNNQHIYVVQASAEWSKTHLEQLPSTIGNQLKDRFLCAFDLTVEAEVIFSHRWRYGFTEKPLGKPYLWDREQMLGVCGDWCLGRRVEDAWLSGNALATEVLSD